MSGADAMLVVAPEGLPGGFPRGREGRFRRVRLLATGGFGAVWPATRVDLDRPAAVTLFCAGVPDDSDA